MLVNDEAVGAKLYIDGVKVGRTALYRSNKTINNSFFIGRYDSSANYYFIGLIDEFIIYDTPLSSEQVKNLYAHVSR